MAKIQVTNNKEKIVGDIVANYGYMGFGYTCSGDAELMAIYMALFFCKGQFVEILSDNLPMVEASNKMAIGKFANNTYRFGLKMKEKFNKLKIPRKSFDIKWVRGHNGSIGNELADYYCVYARLFKTAGRSEINPVDVPRDYAHTDSNHNKATRYSEGNYKLQNRWVTYTPFLCKSV